MSLAQSNLLRRALQVDGAVSGATGLLMFAAGGALSPLLGLPKELLQWAGLALLPFAVFVGWLSARTPISRPLAWGVVAVNLLWVADSVLLLMSGKVEPTLLGWVFVLGQAAIVLLFAELQYFGLKRAGRSVAT